VKAISTWVREHYPRAAFPSSGLLVGCGHNGADALGTGVELLKEGRHVIALVLSAREQLKPATADVAQKFESAGGIICFMTDGPPEDRPCPECSNNNEQWLHEDLAHKNLTLLSSLSFWLDGLHGFGLNRSLSKHHLQWIQWIQHCKRPIVAIDLPSGLHADFGVLESTESNDKGKPASAQCLRASETLALGVLKPVHVLDNSIEAMGRIHLLDLGYVPPDSVPIQPKTKPTVQSQVSFCALSAGDLAPLLFKARRSPSSHKHDNGRLLIVAGSEKFPGAAVMACLGASVSGAGLIHAIIPRSARDSVLIHTPEVIFENDCPDLSRFDAIVLGPGWVVDDSESSSDQTFTDPSLERKELFEKIISHIKSHRQTACVVDAGAFELLADFFHKGGVLNERFILTPHAGEFARLFPLISERLGTHNHAQRLNRLSAALGATQQSKATVYFKGARTCIAATGQGLEDIAHVHTLLQSSSLLAHAGHGDVVAGLLGGLLARGLDTFSAGCLAALMQSQCALAFEHRYPAALTLTPIDCVRSLKSLGRQT
jgi:NAD(P)H-hydrate epimerase